MAPGGHYHSIDSRRSQYLAASRQNSHMPGLDMPPNACHTRMRIVAKGATMTTSIGQWARLVAWRRITWSLVLALLLLICLPMPAALASEPVPHSVSTLPAVTPFSRARFTILYTINSSVISTSLYGGGTYIAPDQVSIWLTNTANTHWNELIQIGTTTYTRTNHGTWQKGSTAGSPMIGTLPIAEQLAWLAHNANGMLSYGNELVGDQTATHYQIWLSGSKLLTLGNTAAALSSTARSLLASSTIKYDLW